MTNINDLGRRVLTSVLVLSMLLVGNSLFAQGSSEKKSDKVYIAMSIHGTDNAYWNEEAEGGKLFAASLQRELLKYKY